MSFATALHLVYVALLTAACGMWMRASLALRAERRRNALIHKQAIAPLVSPAYLSHEIRTPLTVIRGAAEILTTGNFGPTTPTQRQFLQTIADNSAAACSLAEDFLVLFSMEKALGHLHFTRVELRELIHEAVHEFRIMHASDIRLNNHGAPIYVHIDARMIKQVLWNLLTNALRHGGEGTQVDIRVSSDNDIALIVVDDNGEGFGAHSPTTLPPSSNSAASTSETALPRSGSGIGMHVVERVMRGHRGRVLIDTTLGYGTQVYLQLPVDGSSIDLSTPTVPLSGGDIDE